MPDWFEAVFYSDDTTGGTAGDGAAAGKDQAPDTKGDAEKGDEGKAFTQDDVNKIIQDRLGKEKAKWEKLIETKVTEAKTEAEKLAKMNADQKAEYEKQKRDEELGKREADITRRELRATALETLAEKGLPRQLADLLIYTDAESTNKSIEAVEKAFRESVEAGVNERLKGNAPPKGGGGGMSAAEKEIAQIFAQK